MSTSAENMKKAKMHLLAQTKLLGYVLKKNISAIVVVGLLITVIMVDPAFAVKVETLKKPIADLKESIFGGWMWVPKIGAVVGGVVMAVYNQSVLPLATGAGIGLGIHFYDSYIDASGALI